ncbi:MAG: hypothetical protein J6C44_00485 [Muribaculaceae bacterium]|nr:hypothetical protein [Muribaculaceae bacterium]
MDINIIQQKWNTLNINDRERHSDDVDLIVDKLANNRLLTLQGKLSRRFLNSALVGVFGPISMILLNEDVQFSPLCFWLYMSFFVIMIPANIYMSRRARNLNLSLCTMVEAVESIIKFKRRITTMIVFGWIFMLPVLSILFLDLAQLFNESALWGAIIGGVLGLIIAVYRIVSTYRYIKEMKEMFED